MMTKKDFDALARILSNARSCVSGRTWDNTDTLFLALENGIAQACETSNPRFDRERFLTAARGVNEPLPGLRGK